MHAVNYDKQCMRAVLFIIIHCACMKEHMLAVNYDKQLNKNNCFCHCEGIYRDETGKGISYKI